MPDTVVGADDKAGNKIHKSHALMQLTFKYDTESSAQT